jgi:3-deoxy-D-manno-octulosonate 8-phosphate phosphatase (KDO 8-P phosphatase)
MNVLERFQDVSTFVFDVDGVLTDNTVLVTEEGHQLRAMNVRDGYAIKRAVEQGFHVAIITGGKSEGVIKRLQSLGVTDVFVGIHDKLATLEDYLFHHSLDANHVLYMGDDMPDVPPMREVALPCCPADACPEVMQLAKYVSPYTGGRGCVRDVIEKVLLLNGKWG